MRAADAEQVINMIKRADAEKDAVAMYAPFLCCSDAFEKCMSVLPILAPRHIALVPRLLTKSGLHESARFLIGWQGGARGSL